LASAVSGAGTAEQASQNKCYGQFTEKGYCASTLFLPKYVALCVCEPPQDGEAVCSWDNPGSGEDRLRLFGQECFLALALMSNYWVLALNRKQDRIQREQLARSQSADGGGHLSSEPSSEPSIYADTPSSVRAVRVGALVSQNDLAIESPWSQSTSERRRCCHPPRLNDSPFWAQLDGAATSAAAAYRTTSSPRERPDRATASWSPVSGVII
jgi:hypothetical protein